MVVWHLTIFEAIINMMIHGGMQKSFSISCYTQIVLKIQKTKHERWMSAWISWSSLPGKISDW